MDSSTMVNIGEQRFDRLREEGRFYIDKTGFIKEWWDSGSSVTLITRPRRFGKTLNMNMTECFFSNKYADRADLFEGLEIWNDGRYRQLQGTYPVIFLSFAGIKTGCFKEMKTLFKKIISDEYMKYEQMFQSDIFGGKERRYYDRIELDMADEIAYSAINSLCMYLEKYYGKKTIILLDEYDTPMQEAWLGGYWDEAVRFFRSFLIIHLRQTPICTGGLSQESRESRRNPFFLI